MGMRKAITGMRVLVLMMTSESVLFHFLQRKKRQLNASSIDQSKVEFDRPLSGTEGYACHVLSSFLGYLYWLIKCGCCVT